MQAWISYLTPLLTTKSSWAFISLRRTWYNTGLVWGANLTFIHCPVIQMMRRRRTLYLECATQANYQKVTQCWNSDQTCLFGYFIKMQTQGHGNGKGCICPEGKQNTLIHVVPKVVKLFSLITRQYKNNQCWTPFYGLKACLKVELQGVTVQY